MLQKLFRNSNGSGSVFVGTVLDLLTWLQNLDCVRDVEVKALVWKQTSVSGGAKDGRAPHPYGPQMNFWVDRNSQDDERGSCIKL